MTWIVPERDRLPAELHKSRDSAEIDLIVIHFPVTPWRPDHEYEYKRMRNYAKSSRSSTHLVNCRNGRLLQMVSLDRAAEHTSEKLARFDGAGGVDARAIGIDVVNVGPLKMRDGRVVDDYGGAFDGPIASAPDGTLWEEYTQAQLDTMRWIVEELVSRYPVLGDPDRWVGHSEIQSNKIDPGPCFPINAVKEWVRGAAGGVCG